MVKNLTFARVLRSKLGPRFYGVRKYAEIIEQVKDPTRINPVREFTEEECRELEKKLCQP